MKVQYAYWTPHLAYGPCQYAYCPFSSRIGKSHVRNGPICILAMSIVHIGHQTENPMYKMGQYAYWTPHLCLSAGTCSRFCIMPSKHRQERPPTCASHRWIEGDEFSYLIPAERAHTAGGTHTHARALRSVPPRVGHGSHAKTTFDSPVVWSRGWRRARSCLGRLHV